ncbi:MAG: DUF5320 domain-containing protein [Candidatus Cloacimonetes bacterium]|nr:DUF5320 domain-containing protein [Candidatus Cloacimonadota bacterium]MDD4806849.1 DUF5320 domain-containing protein [Candidatus Cloacimonadota bacterium]
MPNRDGTGPMGDGRPGRGMGPCAKSGFFGCGRRFGRGFRGRWQGNTPYRADYQYSRENLEAEKQELEAQLNWINKELDK